MNSLMFSRKFLILLVIASIGVAGPVTANAQDAVARRSVAEEATPPTVLEKLDSVFASGVDVMNLLLFYRLGQSEREYIVFEPSTAYIRDRDSNGNFEKLNDDAPYPEQELTPDDVRLLAAQNKTTGGAVVDGELRNFRLGRVGNELVDYVVVKGADLGDPSLRYGDKYVLQPDGTYQKLARKRGVPLDQSISQETVDQWDDAGYLRPAEDGGYVHSEMVGGIPIVVAWLACGAVFFTVYMGFFNVWGFRHAVDIVRGKYDNPNEAGEVTHFQALASALSATIGLGNIAGVTIAMTLGGPGAFFWMLLCGAFGMCSKFTECTLGQKYREVKPDGTVLGGPMKYLSTGLAELGLGPLGMFLSILFAGMCVLASFGGGNMLQANQAGSAMLQMFQDDALREVTVLNNEIEAAAAAENESEVTRLQGEKNALLDRLAGFEKNFKVIYGIILALLVGVVIIGGIKRIGKAAEKIVPTMCLIYVAACVFIIGRHYQQVPEMFSLIFSEAFSGKAMGGGILGVLVVGVQRAAFSNEAGAGSAAIAHSAAKTEQPVREGCVALLGPFIDTIIVCTMTALVILITGAWDNENWIVDQGLEGAALTSRAFGEEIFWFPKVLSVAVTLFAYSTIISWSYYGERAWEYMFGARTTFLYKVLAVVSVFVGTVVNLGSVLDFSDMMILGMAFPNIMGVVLLSPKVKRDLAAYWQKYKAGEFPTYK